MNHVGALRVSLLLAIGVVPVACGGTVQRGNQDGEGADTGSGGSRTTGTGGTKNGAAGRGMTTAGTTGKMLPPSGGTGVGGATQTPRGCTGTLDPSTGLVTCLEGYVHRAQQVACGSFGGAPGDASAGASWGGAGGDADPPVLPRANGSVSCGNNEALEEYSVEVCNQFLFGYCGGDEYEEVCESGCIVDEDCGKGAICECGHAESPSGGVCVDTTGCRTRADCDDGSFCASFEDCGSYGFACFSDADECRVDADCPAEDGDGYGYCTLNGSKEHRVCEYFVCGRPFLIDYAARVPAVVQRHDWSSTAAGPRVDHLTLSERDALARHWSRLGQMEHASIAAFARFSLQLLSLGAPAELVEQCTQALADETAHTQLCFQLASAYAGRAIGPGPLDVSGALEVTSLSDIIELVIVEGCFGETGAVLEALESAEAAADPVIREAYSRIAADEQRHAELAFRFVRWALEQDGATVRDCIATALGSELAQTHAARSVAVPCLRALVSLDGAAESESVPTDVSPHGTLTVI